MNISILSDYSFLCWLQLQALTHLKKQNQASDSVRRKHRLGLDGRSSFFCSLPSPHIPPPPTFRKMFVVWTTVVWVDDLRTYHVYGNSRPHPIVALAFVKKIFFENFLIFHFIERNVCTQDSVNSMSFVFVRLYKPFQAHILQWP